MLKLVRQARGRLLSNELLSEGANLFSVALAVFILLLVLGAQVLNWRWAVSIPMAAAVAGVYRALKRRPSLYLTAQVVDRRMRLADTLSTALFFSRSNGPGLRSEAEQWQWEQAERISRTVDVRKAVPYRMPRSAYVLGALFLVASSLFALRYAVTRRLDLKPPLARILQLNPAPGDRTEEARLARPDLPPPDPKSEEASRPAEDRRSNRDGRSEASQEKQPSPADSRRKMAGGKRSQEGVRNTQKEPPQGEQDSDQRDGSDQRAQDGQAGGSPNRQGGASGQGNSGQSSSLMDKFKDAVQNLLSRMKPQPGSQGGRQPSQSAQNGNAGQSRPAGSRQQAGQNGRQSGEQGDAQQGEADRQAQDARDGQGRAAGDSDQQASKQPGSGIGSQDGDKQIRQAEQLQAMGKISEILGRRAANLSGEATVEVQSSNQQLRTPYAQRSAQHREGGAEIGRDEVPVALEAYVEQYFERVRKQKK